MSADRRCLLTALMVRTVVDAGPAETLTLPGQVTAAFLTEMLFAVVLGGVQRGHA
ncbi:MAG: hypothetical protein QOI10_4004 [Solirubrobacterales bacterium]|nr:hypothetical protein [Solirubrobacterales bacterium]